MNLIQLQGALELGLIYSFVSIGVYLSFRVLRFPDLTVDGSFPLGAAVCASLITRCGIHPIIAIALAGLSGALVGWVTAVLSTHLKMLNLLAGILTMSALYSVNLRVMGNKPNLSLLGEATLLQALDGTVLGVPLTLLALLASVVFVALLTIWFLKSQVGLSLRATGSNSRMARSQGVNDRALIGIGLSLSNGCVALGGAVFSQVFGFADVTLGVGTIVIGLASVIIGEALLPTRTVTQSVFGCIAGALLYRLLIACALNLGDLGLQASDLNLITAVLVTLAMSLPQIKSILKMRKII
jgi:putative ABC transport system permease protein